MKHAQKILEAASERLDLPGDITAGLPKLELTGFSQLSVEHHKGVLEYTDTAVTVAVGIGNVRITGTRLSITLMNHSFVVITGRLSNVELIPGGRND